MAVYVTHAERIVTAAVEDVFSRDLESTPPVEVEALLAGYAGALEAIGAKIERSKS